MWTNVRSKENNQPITYSTNKTIIRMKAFKGFNQDMTCRNFQYEEGKTYEEPEAKLCDKGFHACENPIMCLGHYAPGTSVYHQVELEDVAPERGDDTKCVGKKITIGAKLGIPEICQLTFEYVKAHCTNEYNAEPGKPVTAGDSEAATAGENGAATAGSYGAATAGSYGAATAGYRGAATAGSYGAATAGYRGAATAGSYGAATSRGSSSSGKNGLSVARGNGVKVKGGLGAVLVIAEENKNDYDIKEWKAVVVDGEIIKADTWYKLVDGEFKEVEQ